MATHRYLAVSLTAMLCVILATACSTGTNHLPSIQSGQGAAALQSSNRLRSIGLLQVTREAGVGKSADGVKVLLETGLRRAGYRPVEVQRASSTGVTVNQQLEDLHQRGLPYALQAHVRQWRSHDLRGARPSVDLKLDLIDTATAEPVWQSRKAVTGTFDRPLTAVAQKAIKKILRNLPDAQRLAANNTGPATETLPDLTARPLPVSEQSALPSLAAATADRSGSYDLHGVLPEAENFLKVAANRDALRGRSIAIYYGSQPPVDQLSLFDRLVLEPDAISEAVLGQLTQHGAVPYAYMSVGEVGPHRRYASRVQPQWILGSNDTWNSKVMNLADPEWRNFLLQRVEVLHKAGYKGLFLDTMDSFHLYAKTPQARQQQQDGLAELLRLIKQHHPQIRLIANRGFEVLESSAQYLEAIAAESLYASWDNNKKEYTQVSENDRQWLLGQLNTAKDRYGLDVICIDYVPPSRKKEALAVAKVIAAHGFIPWVSTPELDHVGIGLLEPVPRKVMMIYDRRIHGPLFNTQVHMLVATPLEYLGYVPVYHDLSSSGLPPERLSGAYAGMVMAGFNQIDYPGFQEWIEQQVNDGVPLVSFGHPGIKITPEIASNLGLSTQSSIDRNTAKVSSQSSMIGYERDLPPRFESFVALLRNDSAANKVHLTYTDAEDASIDVVVTGDWGGLAMHPAAFDTDVDDVVYWLIDPYAFLIEALNIPDAPMPDVTTENGKRLFLAHIDGDALPSWAEMPGRRLGAEVILDEILRPYDLPHTVSIVEGEMTGFTSYFDRQKRMFDVAREIFALPNVELATHTYSHPFKWGKVAAHQGSGRYNLRLQNYQFSPQREVQGSAKFIDDNLAPADKKTKVFLWSGDALPTQRMLAHVVNSGLINMNGGNTVISKSQPVLSLVSPMARTLGPYVQPYAPIMNENVFTNDWQGPFDGFRRVIETFQLTDKPRRLKPLNIYYHFYAGTKIASLRSLHEIYDWVSKEDINPVYVSEYAVKVPDYREIGIGRYLDGTWKAINLGSVRTLRMRNRDAWPDLANAEHLAGARQLHDGIYLHTDGAETVTFRLADAAPKVPYLVSANGEIVDWSNQGESIRFRVSAKVAVEIELGGDAVGACAMQTSSGIINGGKTADGTYLFKFNSKDTGDVRLNCQT